MAEKSKTLSPVNKSRLHEEIVAQIRGRILDGDFTPGEKLPPERDLAESLMVNRATVREAIKKLEIMGLVEIHHGDGIYVKNYLESGNLELLKAMMYMSEKSAFRIIPQLLVIRGLLTPEMASRAATNRSEDELAEIRDIVEAGESVSVIEADLALHHVIARASGNVPYIFILNFFNQLFKDFGGIYFSSKENEVRSRKFHRDMYDAIRRKDERKARRVMGDVLRYTEERIAEAMNRSAGSPAPQYNAVEAKEAQREA